MLRCAFLLILTSMLTGTSFLYAAISSEDNERLQKILSAHPEADSDGDGVLSYVEYREYLKVRPRKRPDGGPAGPMMTLLPSGALLICDFEENNVNRMRQWGWQLEGNAFSRDLAHATRLMKRRTLTHRGKYFLSSYADDDSATGRIRSPEFTIEKPFLEFQLSGGRHPGKICVNLVADGKVERTITGRNRDLFELVAFDVTELQGRTVRLEIVDQCTKIWGHLNVDQIVHCVETSAARIIRTAPEKFGEPQAIVLTSTGRVEGSISLNDGQVRVADQVIRWQDTIQVAYDQRERSAPAGNAVRMRNGELWFGKIGGLAKETQDKNVTVRVAGLRKVDGSSTDLDVQLPLAEISSLEFKPPTTDAANDAGTLYRDTGEPIPGELIWIRDKDVAIKCVLGIVPVPRPTITRFVVMPVETKLPVGLDRVVLVNGTTLFGKLGIQDSEIRLEHSRFGTLSLTSADVYYLQRGITGVNRLVDIPYETQRQGPNLPPPPPEVVTYVGTAFQQALRVRPTTTLQFAAINGSDQQIVSLHTTLVAVPNCRVDSRVEIRQAGKVLFDDVVTPKAPPQLIEISLATDRPFEIIVDFAGPIRFPCGVDLQDPIVVPHQP